MATTATRPAARTRAQTWRNWAGDQACTPATVERPRSREQLAEVVRAAADAGRTVHVAGSGHSFTEAAKSDDVMVQIEALNRVLDSDSDSGLVKVEAGIVLADLNEALQQRGLAMENLGDIDRQTIAGAISTGTHGTGAKLRNISAQVEAMELITADGELQALTAESSAEELLAARVSIGALGAIYSVTLRCVPSFTLHRVDEPRPLSEVVSTFDRLADANDHFEFFVFPYTEKALTLRRNRSDRSPEPRGRARAWLSDVLVENTLGDLASRLGRRFTGLIPRLTRYAAAGISQGERLDRSYRIFANERRIRFTEMEYGIPREHGAEAVPRVLDWIRSNRYPVGFPIECRVVAPDDALLSPSHERETVYIAVHQYRGMEWRPYFEAVEAIMNEYGGRPHWGKRHFHTHETLAERYPRWADFAAVRDRLDPDRTFRNEYTDRVLGP
ncbi:MAG: D-arabinono-1,4-lactone oxidase [Actinomycetota bacterium]